MNFKEIIEKARKELYCQDKHSFDDVCYTYYVCPNCSDDLTVITMLPIIDKEKCNDYDILETQKGVLKEIFYANYDFLHEQFKCECCKNCDYQLKRIAYCYYNNNIDYHNYIDFPFENIITYQFDYKNLKTNKYFLFFDTETTGLPKNWNSSYKDIDNWPRLIQIAWILADENGSIKSQSSCIIKPEGFLIPDESTRINRITNENANTNGVQLKKVLNEFNYYFSCCDFLIAHNLKFDFNVVAAEFYRNGTSLELNDKKMICTMLATIDFCKIPGFNGHKYPKLVELYEKLFEKPFENAHSADIDTCALYECFYELHNRQIIKI